MNKYILTIGIAISLVMSVFAGHGWDGSKTVPLHRINILNEEGEKIVPEYKASLPLSSKQTCGACHDYKAIASGFHFNAGTESGNDGRKGEPWVLVDVKAGTQMPVSGRKWDGSYHPSALGLTDWKFIKHFGRHMPGGGAGEPSDILSDPESRWDVSGQLEVNCLACHSGSKKMDMTEWAKQIGRENYRWAATSASGIGIVGGMASRLSDTWCIYDGPNKDDTKFAVAPHVDYNKADFDAKGRAIIDIAESPLDKRCLHCHSSSRCDVERKDNTVDVHSSLSCVSCHKNDIGHDIARGDVGSSSCASCHIGSKDGSELPGKYGAPMPAHKGLPPVHLEKIACTTCHSGVMPEEQAVRVRTSRANRLGIHGVAKWAREMPNIVEPVFMKNEQGKIAPHRMMWPAFWCLIDGDKVTPVDSKEIYESCRDILDAEGHVARILNALNATEDAPAQATIMIYGKAYQEDADGGLDMIGALEGEDIAKIVGWVWMNETDMPGFYQNFDPAKFDSEENDADAEIEEDIIAIFEALKAVADEGVVPVVVVQGVAFTEDEDGYLQKVEISKASDGLGWLKDGVVLPMVDDYVIRAIDELNGTDKVLNEEILGLVLNKLGDKYGYVSSGLLFKTVDGKVVADDHPSAEPVSWPIAHDVRPASQSLGSSSCKDCHTKDSNFFNGKIVATGPLSTGIATVKEMHEMMDESGAYHKMFGLSFTVRPIFKLALLAAMLLMVAVLVLYGLRGLKKITAIVDMPATDSFLSKGVCVSSIVLAVTGFGLAVCLGKSLHGWPLLIHTMFGALFAACLTLLAVLRADKNMFTDVKDKVALIKKACFWILVVLGVALIFSILIAMIPLLGTAGQLACMAMHKASAMAFVVVSAIYLVILKKGK